MIITSQTFSLSFKIVVVQFHLLKGEGRKDPFSVPPEPGSSGKNEAVGKQEIRNTSV